MYSSIQLTVISQILQALPHASPDNVQPNPRGFPDRPDVAPTRPARLRLVTGVPQDEISRYTSPRSPRYPCRDIAGLHFPSGPQNLARPTKFDYGKSSHCVGSYTHSHPCRDYNCVQTGCPSPCIGSLLLRARHINLCHD